MNKLRGYVLELGEPAPDVVTALIVILGLLDNIEAIQTSTRHTGGSTPIAPIGVYIIVKQRTFKVFRTVPPILIEFQCQKGGNVLATAIRLEASGRKFALVGIHQGKPGPTMLPRLDVLLKVFPILVAANRASTKEDCIAMFESKELNTEDSEKRTNGKIFETGARRK